jgi:hypothetical protein
MTEQEARSGWSFPEGAVGHDESVKGYEVECPDGDVGKVSWACYAPGESYLVVTYRHHLHEMHHVVPAGAVSRVDHDRKTVALTVTCDQVKATPQHAGPEEEVDWGMVDQFERGMLGGGFVWPYTDI